jgi:DNA-binding SARP family transcriptional activator
MLAWLALEGPTSRARIAALLWPDSEPEVARTALRQRLFRLGRQCGMALVAGGATLALAEGVAHDLEDSDGVLGEAVHAHSAEFSGWLAQQRERRRGRTRDALAELADMAEGARDFADALSHAQELLAFEPLSEAAHRRVMRIHYLAGNRAAALLAFDACERMLKNEVGATPSAETLALLTTIEAAVAPASRPMDGPVPASVLRPPRLIGRGHELAGLSAAWHSGQVLALIGEAGLGKTRLLQTFIDTHPGIARAAGRPGDAGVPFATLARLLRAVVARGAAPVDKLLPPATRSEIARVLPELDTAASTRTGEGQRLVMQRAVRALLQSQPGLTGLVVDDLHFADEASLEMLGSLIDGEDEDDSEDGGQRAHEPGSRAVTAAAQAAPLRWALAYRPADAGSPVQALHDGLVEQARLAPLALQPLDEPALAELVDSLGLPGVDGRTLAAGLRRRTGGNPLFVLETLKQAWVERTLAKLADVRQLPRPVSVGRLIERRVTQLSPGALALARVASIAGVDFDIAMAEEVLGASAMQFADALNDLEAAQVLRGTQFAHDLVFDAVRGSVPAAIAAHTHARVAAWLERHDGEPARLAQHWIDAVQPARAMPWLQKAADAAWQALRPKEYVAFLERKSEIEEQTGDLQAAFDTLYTAAEEFISVDRDPVATEAHCQRLERLAQTPAQRVDALLHRGHLLLQQGRPEQAVTPTQAALQHCLQVGDAARTAHARQQLSAIYVMSDDPAQALEQLQACMGWFDEHGSDKDRAVAHGDAGALLDNLGRLDDALPHHRLTLEMMRKLGDFGNLAIGHSNLACNRIDAGDLAEAEAALQRAQQIEVSIDNVGAGVGVTQFLRALSLCHLGRYGSALAQAEAGVESMRRYQPGNLDRAELRLAQCWWHLGQWARVGTILSAREPDADSSLPARLAHARLAVAYAQEAGADRGAAQAARAQLFALWDEFFAADERTRPDLALPLRIELADPDDPEAALAQIEAARAQAQRIGHLGTVQAAHIRAAALATLHDPARARREARAALALADRGRNNTCLLPAELWLHAGRALLAAADPQATTVLAQGCDWVRTTAQEHVPEPFRDAFLHRNPANRELLELAARCAQQVRQ